MKRILHIIVLRTIRHNDRHNIVTAYSLEAGRVSFLVPAGAGREAARRRALLMPLAPVELVASDQAVSDLMTMADPSPMVTLHSVTSSPVKSSIALFVAEVLATVLREGAPDRLLFDHILRSVTTLEEIPPARAANFHLSFLISLAGLLGIGPDAGSYRPGMVFDLIDGRFRLTAPLHTQFLAAGQSAVLARLLRMDMTNMHLFRFSRRERNEALDLILEYYSLHYTSLASLRSLEILRELF